MPRDTKSFTSAYTVEPAISNTQRKQKLVRYSGGGGRHIRNLLRQIKSKGNKKLFDMVPGQNPSVLILR